MIPPIINPLVEEFERRSVRLAPEEEAEIRQLLSRYEPVLRFHHGERFFPVSAMLYMLFSTIWYTPLQSREGEDIKGEPYQKRARPGLFELWRNRPHIQLNTKVEQDVFAGAPAQDQCFHRPVPRPSWYHPMNWAGLECAGGEACDHELRGYYGYGAPDSAWQTDWGTDGEWESWAEALAH